MEGKIVLITFPQDISGKRRPAFVLKRFPVHGDYLVCAISTQLHQFVNNFDVILDSSHPDFALSGLQKDSVVRLNVLTMIRSEDIVGAIGNVSETTRQTLLKNLSDYLLGK